MQVDNQTKQQSIQNQGFQIYNHMQKSEKQENNLNMRVFDEIEIFRNYIKNQLLNVRKELEFILFAFILYFVKKCIYTKKGDIIEKVKNNIKYIKDILLNKILIKHLDYIESNIYNLELEKLNYHYQQLMDSNHIKQIYLTQFSYECLYQFLSSNHLSFILNEIPNYIQIKIIQNEQQEQNYKETLIFLEKINLNQKDENIGKPNTLICKQDMYLYQTLDQLIQKKNNCEDYNSQFNNIDLKLCPESNQMIFIERMKEKVVFAKNYLLKRQIDEKKKPNILRIEFEDKEQVITCIESEHNCQIVLVGTLEGVVQAYLLEENMNYNYKKQKNGGGAGEKNLIIVQTIEEEEQYPCEIDDKLSDQLDHTLEQDTLHQHFYKHFHFYGHQAAITTLTLTQCQQYFLSASTDTTIRLWCLRQKECLVIYKGHVNTIWCLKVQQKGYYFVSGSSDKTVRLWSTDKLQSVRILVGHQADISCVLFSNCMNHIVSSSLDGTVRLWSIETGLQLQIYYHHSTVGVTSIAISNNGMLLVTAGVDGSVLLWNLLSGQKVNSVQVAGGQVNSLHFSYDDQSLSICTRSVLYVYLTAHFQATYSRDIMLHSTHQVTSHTTHIQPIITISNQTHHHFILAKYNIKNYLILISRTF